MNIEEARLAWTQKLNISLTEIKANTQELFNWDDMDGYIKEACLEAWDYAPWIFKHHEKIIMLFLPHIWEVACFAS